MENLYRIEENETTGWNLIDPQNDVKLTKEQATERLTYYMDQGYPLVVFELFVNNEST